MEEKKLMPQVKGIMEKIAQLQNFRHNRLVLSAKRMLRAMRLPEPEVMIQELRDQLARCCLPALAQRCSFKGPVRTWGATLRPLAGWLVRVRTFFDEQFKKKKLSGRPVASSAVRHTTGWHWKGSRPRLEGAQGQQDQYLISLHIIAGAMNRIVTRDWLLLLLLLATFQLLMSVFFCGGCGGCGGVPEAVLLLAICLICCWLFVAVPVLRAVVVIVGPTHAVVVAIGLCCAPDVDP